MNPHHFRAQIALNPVQDLAAWLFEVETNKRDMLPDSIVMTFSTI